MDEKTEELREIFTAVTDEETVTESQEEGRGSLELDEHTVEERVETVIDRMRERYGLETSLSTAELVELTTGFYEDRTDEALADELGVDPAEVFRARLSLHLVRDDDADGVDLVAIRDREADDATLAAEFDVSEVDIQRYRQVAAAKAESRAANDRYRDELDSLLADADIAGQMTSDVREDGLEDATEGMETNVSF